MRYSRVLQVFLCFRYELERFSVGISPVVPLDVEEQKKPLGPGYKSHTNNMIIAGTKSNCRLSGASKAKLSSYLKKMLRYRSYGFERYGQEAQGGYHNWGHMLIGNDCTTDKRYGQVLRLEQAAAREPLFYRWHSHLENLMQEYRDQRSRK